MTTPYRQRGQRPAYRKPYPQRPRPAQPHRAYSLVLRLAQHRMHRLTALLAAGGKPGKQRWRASRFRQFGRDSYVGERRAVLRHVRLCQRAIGQGWSRVPRGADSALAAVERLRREFERTGDQSIKRRLWAAQDELRALLFT